MYCCSDPIFSTAIVLLQPHYQALSDRVTERVRIIQPGERILLQLGEPWGCDQGEKTAPKRSFGGWQRAHIRIRTTRLPCGFLKPI